MNRPIFITGIGTEIGKTVVAAIVTEALQADYWKPVQAGFSERTDALLVKELICNSITKIWDETYKLKLAASLHIAAKQEGIKIDLNKILSKYKLETQNQSIGNHQLIIEGAGGLLVPLNEDEFVIDLIKNLNARVILISRNYLGSINHSLLTAQICKANNLDVIGWIFNDQYLNYENDIERWSGYKRIYSVPHIKGVNKTFIQQQALLIKETLISCL